MRAERRYTAIHNDRQVRTQKSGSHRRRAAQLRRRVLAAVITLGLSLAIGILSFGFLSKAQSEKSAVSYKYFTSIQIQPGDTLLSIAQEYADDHYSSIYTYMEEVCRTNHLLDDDIKAGDYLIVPYYSTEFR